MPRASLGPSFTLLLLAGACGPQAEKAATEAAAEASRPPTAQAGTHRMLLDDLAAERHPSDGGGKAWIVEPKAPAGAARPVVVAGSRARFQVVYEAGPLGVAEGGIVFLQTSPFWDWDTPQAVDPERSGYTEVSTTAEGIELLPWTAAAQLLAITIQGRGLEAGERLQISYGAGPLGARVDRYAERESRMWLAVDGDGDGVRALVADSPTVDVAAAEPARLLATLPTTARPGETVRLALAVLDAAGSAGYPFEGEIALQAPAGLALPARLAFAPEDRGRLTVEAEVSRPGVYRLRATGPDGLEAESNPLVVRPGIPRLLWADLHGHSNLSDGTGTPEDFLTYARDVAALDVAALTDHDHWGMQFLDAHPGLWQRIRDATERFHEPGRFVTLSGYEWTNWIHGHRHVLCFEGPCEILSSLDPRYGTPEGLWEALHGRKALTFAHHSAGGPVATDWSFAPDPVLEPVTEVVSVHGSSEALDSPGLIYSPRPGNFVRDVLDRGYRLGFVGSGDSHDGHPGLAHLASPGGTGGVAAIFAGELTREAVLAALRARSSYATSGPRIWLWADVDGHPMGSILGEETSLATAGASALTFEVIAPGVLDRLDVVRSGEVTTSLPGDGQRSLEGTLTLAPLAAGEYLYLRAVQEDGGAAWSSPVWRVDTG